MPTKEVALQLAAFLDAPQARSLAELRREDVRALAETLLTIAYEDLGKKPRLLEGDDVEAILATFLPARLAPRDARAAHVPAVFAALLAHLEASEVVPHAWELRRALDAGADAFLEKVRSGANAAEQLPRQSAPFVHRAEKLGRNDPCSCGSGKKFKKCHGKEA